MASRIPRHRCLPMRKRIFESSRLHEELMAAAYAVAAPSFSSLLRASGPVERQPILDRTSPALSLRKGSMA
jgi:hypothetical protein